MRNEHLMKLFNGKFIRAPASHQTQRNRQLFMIEMIKEKQTNSKRFSLLIKLIKH